MTRCDQTVAWRALQGHYEVHGRELDLRDAFVRDPARFATLSLHGPEVFADLSKNRCDLFTRKLLIELAHECGMPARRDAMSHRTRMRGCTARRWRTAWLRARR